MLDADVVSLSAIISQINLSHINYDLISLHYSSFTGEQWDLAMICSEQKHSEDILWCEVKKISKLSDLIHKRLGQSHK